MITVALLFDNQWILNISSHYPSLSSLISVGFLGVFNTALAGILFFYILQKNGAIFTAQCNFLIPIFGVFWGFVFLGEKLNLRSGLSLMLILLGIAIIQKTKIVVRNSKRKNKVYWSLSFSSPSSKKVVLPWVFSGSNLSGLGCLHNFMNSSPLPLDS